MKSMTGYAYKESSKDNISVCVEIKGYNSRFLDLSVYLPSWLSPLEPEIRKNIGSRFARGKVDITADAVVFSAYNQANFAVNLKPGQPVNHMTA